MCAVLLGQANDVFACECEPKAEQPSGECRALGCVRSFVVQCRLCSCARVRSYKYVIILLLPLWRLLWQLLCGCCSLPLLAVALCILLAPRNAFNEIPAANSATANVHRPPSTVHRPPSSLQDIGPFWIA